ncbi:MAG: sulfatase [Zavarzinella sp.]
MRILLSLLCVGLFQGTTWAAERPNVLFIAIDDLNDWLGCLKGHSQAYSPNIDKLAARGTLFTNAHCQAPLCNPSRSSLLTGLRPSSTGIHGLQPGIRQVPATKNLQTLPQTFLKAGYHTYTCGKIYHDGSIKPAERAAEFATWGPAPGMGKPANRIAKLPGKPHPLMDWGPFPEHAEDAADYKIASAAVQALNEAPKDQPFFIAAGFRLPHVPCFAPPEWFAKFPIDKVQLPPIKRDDRDDTPRFSWYLHWKLPEPRLKTLEDFKEITPLVRGYLASVAFVDAMVGRVLDALEKTGRTNDTIVVLWSDHGYHLGEKLISGKNTLWERSTHVPLIFAGPGCAAKAVCTQPAELLDIFPTLLELGKLPARADLDGHSLVPQLQDASKKRPWPAITTHNQGNHAVRDDQFRYIRYADGTEEMYDMKADPNEWTNLLAPNATILPATKERRDALAKWLPKVDLPATAGSAHRVLTYDKKTGQVTWEGQPIGPKDPIPLP